MLINRGESGREMPPSEVKHQYFIWLCNRGNFTNGFDRPQIGELASCYTHYSLAETLHDIPFTFSVPNDINRLNEGKKLREIFAELHSDFSDYSAIEFEDVSVLEMLIAFAERIDTSVMRSFGDDEVDRSKFWLWLMLDNLGISDWDDDSWCLEAYQDVIKKVKIFLNRDYDQFGRGGLFPLENSTKDQRTVEIWYQMQEYCTANWDGLNETFTKKSEE